MRRSGRSRRTPQCRRCGNEDDLSLVTDDLYCLPCRTCPHGATYLEQWTPACRRCVREMHTVITHAGPAIVDLSDYVRDAMRWGISPAEAYPWTFAEMERLLTMVLTTPAGPAIIESPDRPPHFSLGHQHHGFLGIRDR